MSETDLATRYVRDLVAGAGTGNPIAGFRHVSSDGICPNGCTLCHEGGPTRDGGKLHMAVSQMALPSFCESSVEFGIRRKRRVSCLLISR